MKKRFFTLFLSAALLSGCASAAASIQPLPKSIEKAPVPSASISESAEEGYAAFSAELLRQSRMEGENTLVSPLSAALALGMTANGAAGDTKLEFEALFGMELDALNAYCANALHDYTNLEGSTKSTIVNSLWCDPNLELNESFIARCQQTYCAELYHADLQDAATVRALNSWVKKATEGLIPETLKEFSPDAVLALVNAIYLQNKFAAPFKAPAQEWKMDFTAENGSVTHPHGMHNGTRNERYLSHGSGSGVLLPYDDNRLGFLLMLPEKGTSLTSYLSGWDGTTVKDLLENQEYRQVSLTVPKFEMEWSGSLRNILAEMDLSGALDSSTADFTAMGHSDNGPLFIGDVIHKTVLKVNEKGTEAAAVTSVIMNATSAKPPENPIDLRFDRPFVCGIVDLESGAPLFLGTVETLK